MLKSWTFLQYLMKWQGKHAKAGAVPAKQGAIVSPNIRDYLAGFYLAFHILQLFRAG
jgi:hypothetical protein